MTEPKPGDRVLVTIESIVESDGWYRGQGVFEHYQAGVSSVNVLSVTREVEPRGPKDDPIGTVRKWNDREDAGSPVRLVKVAPDLWIWFQEGSWNEDTVASDLIDWYNHELDGDKTVIVGNILDTKEESN